MCAPHPKSSSARIEHIVDRAAARGPYPTWKLDTGELTAALDRAVSDARTLERAARQRRRAIRFLARIVEFRADLAARRAARQNQVQVTSLQAAE